MSLKVAKMSLYLTFNGLYCAVRPCRPRKGSIFDTVPDERLYPKIWEALCMPVAFTLAPGKPNLWSNTDVVNALHANKMHTVTKSELKPRKKTCSPWNKLIVTWVHSASEFKWRAKWSKDESFVTCPDLTLLILIVVNDPLVVGS